MRSANLDVSRLASADHSSRPRPARRAPWKTPQARATLGLAAILCLALTACAGQPVSEQERPLAAGYWPEADEQCRRQPALDWCRSLPSKELKQTDLQARTKFQFRPDGPIDTWRSYADQVIRGISWAGDCDDLSSTVLDLLGRRGVPLEDRYRVLVSMAKNGKVDHMIGMVVDSHGKFWIVGDTNQQIYPARAIYYQAIEYNRLSETINGAPVWRQGLP
jgi:hypothetical protein